jgi:antitoxin CptB
MDSQSQQQRLRWQCRRGMLELDLLLRGFLEEHYQQLNEHEQGLFVALLDTPDQELLELLMGRETHKDACINDLIRKIRQPH